MREVNSSFRPLYDPTAVEPMRDELRRVGIKELRTAAEVDAALGKSSGTALVVVNSVCGCAAGNARPGAMLALQSPVIPDHLYTVFAGQDRDATERARSFFSQFPPSSPCIVLLKDGEVHTIIERHRIEGRGPQDIARELGEAFQKACTRPGPSIPPEEFAKILPVHACGSSIPRYQE